MIHHSDCIDILRTLPDGSIDMILQDPPYNITSCSWECDLDFPSLWKEWERVVKPTGIIAMTASQPFTSALVLSNPKLFKHEWQWIKNKGSNFANTVREPFKEHETVVVFSRGGWTWNPQMQERTGAGEDRVKYDFNFRSKSENYREFEVREGQSLPDLRVPSSWQKFNTETGLHPTQKPVPLFRYLIRTYTNEGETVFDGYAGSGTTAVACHLENRKYICCEREPQHHETATKRIEEATRQVCLFR